MLNFLSCWHYIFTDYPYLNFAEKGFQIQPISEQLHCGYKRNSIYFADQGILQSLQFREVLDEEEFMREQKQKMDRRGTLHDLLRPGLCILSEKEEDHISLSGLDVILTTDKNMILQNSEVTANLQNQNSDFRIGGLFLNLSGNDLDYFCKRLSLKVNDHKIILNPQFSFYLPDAEASLAQDFEARKDFSLWAVIIEKKHIELEQEIATLQDASLISWQKKKAILLKQHITHWDVILTAAR